MVWSRSVKGPGSARTEGARRATGVRADAAAGAAGALAPGQRWSASRKRDVVLRLLRGESLDPATIVRAPDRWRPRHTARLTAPLSSDQPAPPTRSTSQSQNEILIFLEIKIALAARRVSRMSVVVGGKFVLRVGLEDLRERHGTRPILGFQGLTGPGRNPRWEAGEKTVAGELFPGPAVSPTGLREAFDPVGHVGHIHRPLRAGLGASAAEVTRGHGFGRNQRFFGPFCDRDVRGGALFVNVHRGVARNFENRILRKCA